MKLYTENQVRQILHLSELKHLDDQSIRVYTDEELLKTVTPIELPSEKDIERDIFPLVPDFDDGFIAGGKWVINHIKQQDNEK
jgi:hypothetical protein